MRGQRNQKREQSGDLHPGQTASTAPDFALKTAAFSTLSHLARDCQVTAKLARSRASAELASTMEDTTDVSAQPASSLTT